MDQERKVKGPIYVTQWALTQGIRVYSEGRVVDEKYFQGGDPRLSCSDPTYCFVGINDWMTDPEEAFRRVRSKVEKKLKSLEKQRVKLEKLLDPKNLTFVEMGS